MNLTDLRIFLLVKQSDSLLIPTFSLLLYWRNMFLSIFFDDADLSDEVEEEEKKESVDCFFSLEYIFFHVEDVSCFASMFDSSFDSLVV